MRIKKLFFLVFILIIITGCKSYINPTTTDTGIEEEIKYDAPVNDYYLVFKDKSVYFGKDQASFKNFYTANEIIDICKYSGNAQNKDNFFSCNGLYPKYDNIFVRDKTYKLIGMLDINSNEYIKLENFYVISKDNKVKQVQFSNTVLNEVKDGGELYIKYYNDEGNILFLSINNSDYYYDINNDKLVKMLSDSHYYYPVNEEYNKFVVYYDDPGIYFIYILSINNSMDIDTIQNSFFLGLFDNKLFYSDCVKNNFGKYNSNNMFYSYNFLNNETKTYNNINLNKINGIVGIYKDNLLIVKSYEEIYSSVFVYNMQKQKVEEKFANVENINNYQDRVNIFNNRWLVTYQGSRFLIYDLENKKIVKEFMDVNKYYYNENFKDELIIKAFKKIIWFNFKTGKVDESNLEEDIIFDNISPIITDEFIFIPKSNVGNVIIYKGKNNYQTVQSNNELIVANAYLKKRNEIFVNYTNGESYIITKDKIERVEWIDEFFNN